LTVHPRCSDGPGSLGPGAREPLIAPAGGLAKTGRGGTTNAGSLVGPRFSPDGRRVAYIRTAAEIDRETRQYTRHEAKVWVVGLDGKERRVVFEGNDAAGVEHHERVVPDGFHILPPKYG